MLGELRQFSDNRPSEQKKELLWSEQPVVEATKSPEAIRGTRNFLIMTEVVGSIIEKC